MSRSDEIAEIRSGRFANGTSFHDKSEDAKTNGSIADRSLIKRAIQTPPDLRGTERTAKEARKHPNNARTPGMKAPRTESTMPDETRKIGYWLMTY
jgi:hypothetical protein